MLQKTVHTEYVLQDKSDEFMLLMNYKLYIFYRNLWETAEATERKSFQIQSMPQKHLRWQGMPLRSAQSVPQKHLHRHVMPV